MSLLIIQTKTTLVRVIDLTNVLIIIKTEYWSIIDQYSVF